MGIFYDHNDSTYVITAGGDTIRTTVTASGDVASYWIDEILRINGSSLNHLIVGFDVEWCPYGRHGTSGENPAALLQLCVGQHCLLFQLVHSDYIPLKLSRFLSDNRFRFVGVAIRNDLVKLQNEYGLRVGSSAVDLPILAAVKTGRPEMRQWGLPKLLLEFTGYIMVKPRRIVLSDWSRLVLDPEQIEYAAIDAIASLAVGRLLLVGNF